MTPWMTDTSQSGQAAAEALVLLLGTLVLWFGIAWLARLQDMALQAGHGARYAAFLATRDARQEATPAVQEGVFSGPGAQWRDIRSVSLFETAYAAPALQTRRGAPLPAQIGANHAAAQQLRQEWAFEDKGLLTAALTLAPIGRQDAHAAPPSLLGLAFYASMYPRIMRQAAIATDAGHSPGDQETALRIAESATAWGKPVAASRAAGQPVALALRPVDAAWGRAAAGFEWLQAWAADVPQWHVQGPASGSAP